MSSGKAKLVRTDSNGRQQTLGIYEAGQMLGFVNGNDQCPGTAITLSESTLWFLPTVPFEGLLRRSPDIALKLLREQSKQLQEAYDLIRDLAFKSVPQRIASLLLSLTEEHGEPASQGILLDDCLSRRDLAERIGTCQETVIRTLSQMGRANVIKLRKRQIIIVNLEKLKTLAEI